MSVFNYINRQYRTNGGYLEFFKIAVPLIISTSIGAIQLFVNRTFLSWYSQEAFAASVPAGISNFALISLFLGTLAYVDVFVAQYYGKEEYRSIGPAVWQSVYLAFAAALIILFISFFAQTFFMSIGHPVIVAQQEGAFFQTLCYGAFVSLGSAGLSGFYAGRGQTKIILFIGVITVLCNVILDYCLIFGNFGFAEMGIVGSAWASNISSTVMFALYIILITSKKNAQIYNTRYLKPNFAFMKRLLRYGFPNGVQFFADMAGFGIFMLIIGTLGIEELASSNIALNINHLVIMPLVGCGITTSIMVGNYLGRNKPSIAQASVRSASQIVYAYAFIVIFILFIFPNQLLYPFSGGAQASMIENIRPMAVNLLRILAIYIIFDSTNIIFAAAIKGAGDTAFVMKRLIVLSIFMVIIPTYLIVVVFKLGLYAAWWFMLLYVIALAGSFYFRYKTNLWKKMRVIDMEIAEDE
ncbi:MAG: MATE family efflux transporter [Elusimicrobiota bacterium]|jgi:MATE family multidrug resistance protein|nr:MATE family efflux transporter [Elusimicrobiota bacterium]